MTDTFEIAVHEDTFEVGESRSTVVVRRGSITIGGSGQTDLAFAAGFDVPVTLATALADYGLGGLPSGTEVLVMAQEDPAENGAYTASGGALVSRAAWTQDDYPRSVQIGTMVVTPDALNPSGYVFRVQRQVSFNFGLFVFEPGPMGLDSSSAAGLAIAALTETVDSAAGWKGALGPMPASTKVMRSSMGGQWVTTGVVGNPSSRMVQRAWVQHDGVDWSLIPMLDEWFGELFTRTFDTDNHAPPANAPVDWEVDTPEGAVRWRRNADGSITLFYEILSLDEWNNPTHVNPDTDLLYPDEDRNFTWLGDFRPGQELGLVIDHDLDAGTVTGCIEVTAGWDFETIDADGTHGWKILGTRTDDKLHTIFDPEHGIWLFLKNFPGAARKGSLWIDGTRILAPNAANGNVGDSTIVGDEGETWTFESLGGPVGTGGVDLIGVAGSAGAELSDIPAQSLGAASAGSSIEASRADHVHQQPTPEQIGAAEEGGNIDGSQIQSGFVPDIHIPASIARDSEVTSAISALQPLYALLTSDFSVADSSTTLADVTGLGIAVVTGHTYIGEAILFVTAGTSACDIQIALTTPTGTLRGGIVGVQTAETATVGAVRTLGVITTSGTAVSAGVVTGGTQTITVKWSFVATDTGTLQVRAAQATSTSAAALKVLTGSYIEARRMA